MSTKFVQAVNKTTGYKSLFHDVDNPVELFAEVAAKNSESGQTMNDWNFLLLNYKGDVLDDNYDWKSIPVHMNLGEIFKNFVNPKAGK